MMVETANQPEITLRPDFRSDAEVKLMKTLNKPRKVFLLLMSVIAVLVCLIP